MTHLRNLLEGFSWWLLEPDMDNTFLTDGCGTGYNRAVAARAADRSLAIVYMPTGRVIKLDLRQLPGHRVTARWYDPADAVVSEVNGSPFPAA
jgi:Putative collagen-binding domain of a collagenase